jgi:hypothetical protein
MRTASSEGSGTQERLHQSQDPLVSEPTADPRRERGVGDLVGRSGDILPTSTSSAAAPVCHYHA